VDVVPLRKESGTRLKILEALAMRKAIVTTSIGCEGLDLTHGESALIADAPGDFAGHVVELLRNEPLRQKLASAGHDLVREVYEWSIVHRQLDDAYRQLTHETRRAASPARTRAV